MRISNAGDKISCHTHGVEAGEKFTLRHHYNDDVRIGEASRNIIGFNAILLSNLCDLALKIALKTPDNAPCHFQ